MSVKEDKRRHEMLDAGMRVLLQKGWKGASMLAIARECNASKETLYNWFGDKAGFFEALIRRNAAAVDNSITHDMEVEKGLTSFGRALLELLMGDASIALNRVAIAEADGNGDFGALLVAQGREMSMPVLVRFFQFHAISGKLEIDDFAQAADVFLGLLKGDVQISRLLGVAQQPDGADLDARAQRAAANFLKLYGTRAS